MKRLLVVTGDPNLPDPTKFEASYGPEDAATHTAMVDAFKTMADFQIEVCNDHTALFEILEQRPPDLVVNFCDTGFRNVPNQELHLPAWLELHGIPYTGASPQAMIQCFDKQAVRLIAAAFGVPVAAEKFVPAGEFALPDAYPSLLKPNQADGSVGITKDSVVHNEAQARDYLEWLHRTLPEKDILIQEYLPGPEYGIGIIGNPQTGLNVLPALEVDFSKLPDGLAPILSFESKAIPDSPYWTDIGLKRATLDSETEAQLGGWCKLLFRRFGLRDYGRFDFRAASDGRPRLMEVNPNPAWGNDAKLAFMASFASMSYADMLRAIVDAALLRLGDARDGTL